MDKLEPKICQSYPDLKGADIYLELESNDQFSVIKQKDI